MRLRTRLDICRLLAAGAALTWTVAAQVRLARETDRVQIEIDGKPFGDLYIGADLPKPFLAPLRSASGKIVTRQFPMVQDSGETRDHPHHRGLWIAQREVNGFNFWENEFSYHNPKAGRIVTRNVEIVKSEGKSGTLRAIFDWLPPSGQALLTERRSMVLYSDPVLRIIDLDATLTAMTKTVFGDDKDGTLGIRVADPLAEHRTGVITNSAGGRRMKEVWGKPAEWADYSGTLDGETVGIAIFDHPSSFRHPTRWHARDYGLFAANPFGSRTFDPAAAASEVTLAPGESVRLRYRVVIHPKMDAAAIDRLYKFWAAQK